MKTSLWFDMKRTKSAMLNWTFMRFRLVGLAFTGSNCLWSSILVWVWVWASNEMRLWNLVGLAVPKRRHFHCAWFTARTGAGLEASKLGRRLWGDTADLEVWRGMQDEGCWPWWDGLALEKKVGTWLYRDSPDDEVWTQTITLFCSLCLFWRNSEGRILLSEQMAERRSRTR